MLDGIHKIVNQLWASHPFPVIRLQELRTWELSGYYQCILDGNYLKRGLCREDPRDDIKAGYAYYKDTWKNKDDTIARVASDVGDELGKVAEGLGKAAEGIGGAIKDMFKK